MILYLSYNKKKNVNLFNKISIRIDIEENIIYNKTKIKIWGR